MEETRWLQARTEEARRLQAAELGAAHMVRRDSGIQRTEEAGQLRVEAEGAWRLQADTEKALPVQTGNEEARLLQVVRLGSATSD